VVVVSFFLVGSAYSKIFLRFKVLPLVFLDEEDGDEGGYEG